MAVAQEDWLGDDECLPLHHLFFFFLHLLICPYLDLWVFFFCFSYSFSCLSRREVWMSSFVCAWLLCKEKPHHMTMCAHCILTGAKQLVSVTLFLTFQVGSYEQPPAQTYTCCLSPSSATTGVGLNTGFVTDVCSLVTFRERSWTPGSFQPMLPQTLTSTSLSCYWLLVLDCT